MEDDSLTSEEKLLRLIRKKDNAVEQISPAPSEEGNAAVLTDPGAVQSQKQIEFMPILIRVLAVISLFLFVFVVLKNTRVKSEAMPQIAAEPKNPPVENILPQINPDISIRSFDSYKEIIKTRDIFQAPWEKPVQALTSSAATSSELTKQLKLVGIVLDKDPKAIVEDTATQQTFFASVGEQIGSASVAEILEDKVILIFGEERVELAP